MGPSLILSKYEEDSIEAWIMECGKRGFPVTKTRLLDCVQKFITDSGKRNPFTNNRPGNHWYKASLRRHPAFYKRIAQNVSTTRATITESDLQIISFCFARI